MTSRETTIETGDGGAAAIVAGLLVVAFVVVASFYFFSMNHGTATVIDIPAHQVTISGAPAGQ